ALLGAEPEDEPPVRAGGRSAAGRVLLLDDEEPVRIVTRKMLAALDYDCETVSAGEEAIARYKTARLHGNPFDVVILDLTIPGGMGGNDVARALRDFDPDVMAIVSSGYARDGEMAAFREHGFRAALTKPFTLQELREALDRVLSTRAGKAGGTSPTRPHT